PPPASGHRGRLCLPRRTPVEQRSRRLPDRGSAHHVCRAPAWRVESESFRPAGIGSAPLAVGVAVLGGGCLGEQGRFTPAGPVVVKPATIPSPIRAQSPPT